MAVVLNTTVPPADAAVKAAGVSKSSTLPPVVDSRGATE